MISISAVYRKRYSNPTTGGLIAQKKTPGWVRANNTHTRRSRKEGVRLLDDHTSLVSVSQIEPMAHPPSGQCRGRLGHREPLVPALPRGGTSQGSQGSGDGATVIVMTTVGTKGLVSTEALNHPSLTPLAGREPHHIGRSTSVWQNSLSPALRPISAMPTMFQINPS